MRGKHKKGKKYYLFPLVTCSKNLKMPLWLILIIDVRATYAYTVSTYSTYCSIGGHSFVRLWLPRKLLSNYFRQFSRPAQPPKKLQASGIESERD